MPRLATDDIPEGFEETWQALIDLASRPLEPAPLLAAQALEVTCGADWPVRRAAMEALLRRAKSAENEQLAAVSVPARGRPFGCYTVARPSAHSRRLKEHRPYAVRLDSLVPVAGSCDCPDFLRGSLGLCKHSLHGPTSVHHAALAPRISHDSTEFRWDLWATSAYPVEADAPKWFDPLPFARISGFQTWHDVAVWGARFFSSVPAIGGPARAWVEQQVGQGTQVEFVLRAARFVQDEIRYVGIEVGIARRPRTHHLTPGRRRSRASV